ncbi:Lanthionine synthetase C-like protein [Raineyella antarctica]|uniref:Lanthionine synthetase C-like protein n=1 Tax=Raineyella antarctica TaxID=1577474 RepID=A0A1G6HE80_9ACTN|nr:lanthionine synthetase LanC family protein [Raineyella antarctica]SDB91746.1 Lanthionine synthetase C-like protein [Raineyella antarctica]
MTDHATPFDAVIHACQVRPPRGYTWFGTPRTAVPPSLRGLPPEDLRRYLRSAIQERLYQDAYCLGGARASSAPEDVLSAAPDQGLADALARANTAAGCWEPGWTVVDVDEDSYGIDSGDLVLWVARSDLRPAPGREIRIGDSVRVRMPTGSRELSPGYFSAFSDAPTSALATQPVVRVYLALTPAGAPPAMAALTGELNTRQVPFRLKMLSEPSHYRRADSAVLYLGQDYLPTVGPHLARVFADLAPVLRDTTPLFTRRLAPGIGLAEEPEVSDSFGQHRCGLVAEGLIAAAERGAHSHHERLGHLLQVWQEAGLQVERPHLNPGSDDSRYDCLVPVGGRGMPISVGRSATGPGAGGVGMDAVADAAPDPAPAPLALAAALGERLVASATWHQDRCTWLGVVPTTDDQGRPTLAHGAVGRSLYDGSSGIALFLALLGTVIESSGARETARAAARQSLDPDREPAGPGLYTGTAGRAMAAVTTGLLLRDDALVRDALASLGTLAENTHTDVLSGSAGTVLALLTIAELVDEPRWVGLATTYGDHLLRTARPGRHGLSWPPPGRLTSPDLTGLSHGAGGVGAALVELAVATGDERYADAARGAFAYERSWFDTDEGNWADLRDQPRRTRRNSAAVFRSQWCHGAPGLALTRIRAAEVLGEAALREEATVALGTTVRDTSAALLTGSLGFSLCHGLAGNADALLDGLRTMPPEEAGKARRLVDRIALVGHRRHVIGSAPWPCGVPVPDLEVPGLLLGLAGIGHHFLRAAVPGIPSVLLPDPAGWATSIHTLAHTPSRTRTDIGGTPCPTS